MRLENEVDEIKSKDTVLLTANAGALICCRGKKILVDALHSQKTNRFSRVPDDVLRQAVNGEGDFADTDIALVTHDHPDHYNKNWTVRLLERNPNIQLVTPVRDFSERKNVHILSRPKETLRLAGVDITCKRLPHDGSEYASVANYGYMLDAGGCRIVLLGDGAMDAKAIAAFLDGFAPDLALLNFPFLTLKRGREIMDKVIGAKQTILFHLPEPGDDINGYTQAAQRILLKEYQNDPHIRLLCQSMQKMPVEIQDNEK
jgi:L-ascorbate metabolism protein UlaG (beta-lactamase superfamily)